MGCATSFLNERTDIEYEKEIPLAVQIITDKNEMPANSSPNLPNNFINGSIYLFISTKKRLNAIYIIPFPLKYKLICNSILTLLC